LISQHHESVDRQLHFKFYIGCASLFIVLVAAFSAQWLKQHPLNHSCYTPVDVSEHFPFLNLSIDYLTEKHIIMMSKME